MFEKILYPTDFSEVSQKAIVYLKSLKDAGVKQVIILRVIDERKAEHISQGVAWAGVEVADYLEKTYRRLQERAVRKIKATESELKAAGFDVKAVVEKGNPHLKILEMAEKEGVSAIIIGSHGRSNLGSVLLGSVSDHVIRQAKIPVIVIKKDS